MKRVALLKSRLGPQGGLEKYANRIAEGFISKGFKVSFLTTKQQIDSLHPSISIHSIRTCRWPGFRKMEQFDRFTKSWVSQERPDIVFGMDRNRFQTHLRAGNGVHAAFLKVRQRIEGPIRSAICRINPLHRTILQLEKSAFESPSLKILFTNSKMVKQEILEHYRVDPSKIRVVHNGVEWLEMQSDFESGFEKREKIAKEFGLNPDSFHFLFIGNGYLRKGLRPLLEAIASLKRKDVHLSVLGKESRIDEYKRLSSSLKIGDRVTFFGARSDPRAFYQLADSLIIPSFYDPFANVTVEALAMGLFVVSSKSNGGYEVLTEKTGAVIEDVSKQECVKEALHRALLHPKTTERAQEIRSSVKHLDFSCQIPQLIEPCCANES